MELPTPNSRLLIDLHYFPCIAWFSCFFRFDDVVIERHDNYQKQGYRNRMRIATANKLADLSIPVRSGQSAAYKEVEIDFSQRWQDNHWRTIQSAYGKAPFFEFYKDDVQALIYSRETNLFQFNTAIVTKCLAWLKWQGQLKFSENWQPKELISDQIDFREAISPKKPLPPTLNFKAQRYYQVFGKDFATNLSILDLLFCEGPAARTIIQASVLT